MLWMTMQSTYIFPDTKFTWNSPGTGVWICFHTQPSIFFVGFEGLPGAPGEPGRVIDGMKGAKGDDGMPGLDGLPGD